MKHKIDFLHYTDGSIDKLTLVDCSTYFEKPSNLLYEVKFPSFNKWHVGYGNINSITVLTTKILEADYTNFPDGLYKIRMSVSPNEKVFECKTIFKLDKFKNSIKEYINELSCDSTDLIDQLYIIDKYLFIVENTEDENKAIEYYNLALKKLNKIKDVY